MVTRRSAKSIIEELLDRWQPQIKAAFLEAIEDIKSQVTLRTIVSRLEDGDINGAIEVMHLDAAAFRKLDEVLTMAYSSGGGSAAQGLPAAVDPSGARVVFRFGMRNIESESYLSTHSSQLVTNIVDDQRDAIRETLAEGLAKGVNPRAAALDIIGRINPVTGRREGGIIGLTAAQARAVAAARGELASLDPSDWRAFLQRKRRDKRFDKTILKAIESGKPLDADAIQKIIGKYNDRLLDLRGEMVARTETITSLGKSRDDAIRQQVQSGKIAAQDVSKIWHSAGDARVRDTHRELNHQKVGLDEMFVSPSGATLAYPGDPAAPASERIMCRCWCEYKVDFFASVVRRARAKAA